MTAWQRGVVGVAILLAIARISGITEGLNRWLTDAHWRWHAISRPTPFPDKILVIAVDDKTVKAYGRLRYWSRGRYAALLDRLHEAKAVGLDILFTEEDQRDPQGDMRLAKALRGNGKTALACYEWREARPFSNEEHERLTEALKHFSRAGSVLPNGIRMAPSEALEPPIPTLAEVAAAAGVTSVNADADGVYRSPVILKVTNDGVLLPHISLATACLAEGVSLTEAVTSTGLKLGGRSIPLDRGALLLEPIARRGGISMPGVGQGVPTMSFVDALKKRPDEFRDKIVLIGETATGTTDVRPNPFDNGLRGVELNGEILVNLLYLPPVRSLPAGAQWALILAAVAVPLCLYERLPSRRANLGSAVALVALIGAMEAAFWGLRLIPSWSPVLIGFLGATLLMTVQRYAQEEASKQKLRRSFSMYVAPELVEAIVARPEIADQEGIRRGVAVLFSDVRDFTPYCEQHPPEFVVRQMREYLDEMTAAVDANDGVLDKYVGDEVMALFGPFLPKKVNTSERAVACALDMLDRLEKLNARWTQLDMPAFKIGIGINEGEAVVGNIGGARRMQYTALGDTVNLASRLQEMTKELQAALIVSQSVKDQAEAGLQEFAEFIPRGTVQIRGREQPVPIYEIRRRTAH